MLVIAVALLGALSIFLEFFLPGGILAIVGALLLFASATLFFVEGGSLIWGIIYFLFCASLAVFACSYALSRLRKSKNSDFCLKEDQEGFFASEIDSSFIGKEGVAATDLKPSGHVLIEGSKMQAISQSGYINKGDPIVVVGTQGAYLQVTRRQNGI